MRSVGLVLLAISLLFAAAAVVGLRGLSSARADVHAATAPSATTVVVAARPLGLGETLTADVLKAQPWPEGAAPAGAFRTVAEATAGRPRVALAPIAANEPILLARVSGPGARGTLAATVREGMRASTIRIDDVNGVAGFVLPGDFVDVLVTRPDGEGGAMRADTLLQGVRVLAVDQLASADKTSPVIAKAATIEVTPGQAQKLALARAVGTPSLVLRGSVDPLAPVAAGGPVRLADLSATGAPPPVRPRPVRVVRVAATAPPAPAAPTVEIWRGAQSTSVAVRSE